MPPRTQAAPARMHGRAPGHHGRRSPRARRPLHRLRHAKSRSNSKAPTRSPKPSSTASCSRSASAIPPSPTSAACSSATTTASCRKDLERHEIIPVSPELLRAARAEVRAVKVEPALFDFLLALVRRTRDWPTISLGASPRAAAALLLVAKATPPAKAATSSSPTTSNSPPHPFCATASPSAPKPNSKASTPTASSRDVLAATPLPK